MPVAAYISDHHPPMASRSSSIEFVARIALLTSLTALSIDTMLPALPAIGQSLEVVDANGLHLVITLFVFGMFIGELIFGPLSDSMGRKRALMVAVFVYCAGTVLAMTAPSMELLLAGRVIQGIGVSGPKIISRAMIRDKYAGARMARIFSFIMTIFILIPMVAPAMGQLIVAVSGWRAIFLVFLLIAFIATGWIMVRQPETLPETRRIPIDPPRLLRNSFRILAHPAVFLHGFTAGLVFGIFLVYMSTSQAIFQGMYGKGESFPLYFAMLASGFGLAALMNSRLVGKYGMFRLCRWGLIGLTGLGLLSLILVPGGVPAFPYFMSGCYVMMLCVGVLFANLSAMAMQPLGRVAGLGASLVSAMSSIMAVLIAVPVGRFYDNTLRPLTLVIIISGVLSLVLLHVARGKDSGLLEIDG